MNRENSRNIVISFPKSLISIAFHFKLQLRHTCHFAIKQLEDELHYQQPNISCTFRIKETSNGRYK